MKYYRIDRDVAFAIEDENSYDLIWDKSGMNIFTPYFFTKTYGISHTPFFIKDKMLACLSMGAWSKKEEISKTEFNNLAKCITKSIFGNIIKKEKDLVFIMELEISEVFTKTSYKNLVGLDKSNLLYNEIKETNEPPV